MTAILWLLRIVIKCYQDVVGNTQSVKPKFGYSGGISICDSPKVV